MELIKELINRGIINKEQALSLKNEIKNSHRKPEEVILDQKILSEEDLYTLKSEILNIPLKKKEELPEKVSPETLRLIPEDSARSYQMVPLEKKGEILEVGMLYPEDLKANEVLEFLSRQGKFDYKIFLITPNIFNKVVSQYSSLTGEVSKALEEFEPEISTKEVIGGPKEEVEFRRLAEEAPITKIVSVVLKDAVEGKASDVHIEPLPDKVQVRFRLLGELHSSFFLPGELHSAIVARIKILSRMKLDETRVPQDGRFTLRFGEKNVDFRVSTLPTVFGEKVAIRVLDPTAQITRFEDLGLTGRNQELVEEAIKKPYGLILSTGPTGSGKTTTLYSLLRLFNKEKLNIITLEDPVEYFMGGINQSQVRPEIGYTFARGLRHILRQDPDVIMVGEIRDGETADLATQASLTGHVVLSTLHTNNALGAIPRLIDLGVQPYLIPATFSIAIGQRLVRKLCDYCKKEVEPDEETKEIIFNELENFPEDIKKNFKIKEPFKIWEAQGCSKCEEKGFSGRLGIFEVFSMTKELSDLISKTKIPSESDLFKEAKRQGMISMFQDGILKILNGNTTIREVLRVSRD
ncbi:MAG TPA: GspE/PulE family protein [Candidatus Pacearchaeota archaeon]|nr:GspE/PulE family protein [Candidatus Pacearchaeota archaeon]HPO75309.1 GspE/PulE family protein [Candidatus Pacearchaeota archaeon]